MLDFPRVAWDAYWRFVDDDGWAIASHIALSALMSLFPFLIFVTSLAAFMGSKNLATAATTLILEAWPQQVSEPIAREITAVLSRTRSDILTVGVILAIYFSSNGIEALRVALNRAYRVRETRPWWLTRMESILLVLVSAAALLALGFLIVLGPIAWKAAVSYMPWLKPYAVQVTILRFGLATVAIVITLVLVHKYLPAGRRRMRQITPGVLLTLLMSLVYGVAFGAYLSRMGQTYVKTYAGLASVMVALVFLYAVAFAFVYGGEFNAVLMERHKEHSEEEDPVPAV